MKKIIYGIILICIIYGIYRLYKYYKIKNNEINSIINNTITNNEITKNNEIITNNEITTNNPMNMKLNVYLEITIDNKIIGEIVIELFDDIVPKTCMNFRSLCISNINDKNSDNASYKGCKFHRVIKDFMIQSGDIENNDGTGGSSIYGKTFEDENFELSHNQPGLLSMANKGENTNNSQFFIITKPAEHLDKKHVVFGIVLSGYDIVKKIEEISTDDNDKPIIECIISNCGIKL